jgi:DNA-binding NtrC family response regulator
MGAEAGRSARFGLPTIYVVDDDEGLLELVRDVLRGPDRQVVSFDDPIAAVGALVTTPADLLVVDLSMPWLDGAELIADVRAQQPGLDVVLISGYPRAADLARAAHIPFLSKPLNLRLLRALVDQTLDSRVESFARSVRLPP